MFLCFLRIHNPSMIRSMSSTFSNRRPDYDCVEAHQWIPHSHRCVGVGHRRPYRHGCCSFNRRAQSTCGHPFQSTSTPSDQNKKTGSKTRLFCPNRGGLWRAGAQSPSQRASARHHLPHTPRPSSRTTPPTDLTARCLPQSPSRPSSRHVSPEPTSDHALPPADRRSARLPIRRPRLGGRAGCWGRSEVGPLWGGRGFGG